MLHRITSSSWFAFADLFLAGLSGLLWIFRPGVGILPTIAVALIPWVVRGITGEALFRRSPFDWLVALFLLTAWTGYWAAYDQETAWSKVWFIVLAVLFYYALSSQPVENLAWVCSLLFCIGVGTAIYFFLTHDFVAHPRRIELVNLIGRQMMNAFPRLGWPAIHQNYVGGIVAITTPFALFPAGKLIKRRALFHLLGFGLILAGSLVSMLAIFMVTSRGVIMTVASLLGIWFIWWIVSLISSRQRVRREAVFPFLVLIYLCVVVLFLYAGPANSGSAVSEQYFYGSGSRGELFARSIFLVLDFPFTGGGLGAFPGLYSYYVLGIPNFNVLNSHNLFLDVFIEQGLLGGLAFLLIFLMSIWVAAKTLSTAESTHNRLLDWLTLCALVMAFVHGMVDDYLYSGGGTILALALPGLAVRSVPGGKSIDRRPDYRIFFLLVLALIGFLALNLNKVRSAWFANMGAVQMAKVELAGFPTNQWTEPSIHPKLEQAEHLFQSALLADPANQTANYRLGLIAMLKGDFHSAAAYLENGLQAAPNHRGIIKALGYCYVWLGEIEMARPFLGKIPEAKAELDVYVWWWGVQGRPELAEKAYNTSFEFNR